MPSGRRGPVLRGELLEFGQVFLRERTRALGQVFEEGDDFSGDLAIFGTSDTSAKLR
jgi:hypothetical protein